MAPLLSFYPILYAASSVTVWNFAIMIWKPFMRRDAVTIEIQFYSGKDMKSAIETLGEFRLRYFREFPYLYIGTKENEQGHFAEYLVNPSARFFVARDEENVVGVGIGTMLSTEKEILEQTAEAFRKHDWNPSDFFYFGEMIFSPEYRGRGIGKQMLGMLKKAGSRQDATRFCFLAVDRADDDSRRPQEYIDSATIFQKFGFCKTSIQVVFDWPTIQPDGSVEKSANALSLWVDSI